MKLKIAVLPGDGIGPEIMKQGVAVMDAIAHKFGHEFEYEEALVGATAIDAVGDPYPDATHDICMKADAVLFAAVGDLKYDNNPTAKVRPEQGLLAMRKKLGLFFPRGGSPPRQPFTRLPGGDRKSTRLNSSHIATSRMPSSA